MNNNNKNFKKSHSTPSGNPLPYNRRVRMPFIYVFLKDTNGRISKRAFFFSAFSFLSFVYLIFSMTPLLDFDYQLAGFLLAFLGEQAVVYHKKSIPSISSGDDK